MPTKRSALAALKRLETEKTALAEKQQTLEQNAALEIGQIFLGSGMESFAPKNLKRIAIALGALSEADALARLGIEEN
tara:strand:+ start:34000 stop:34233 length:234 start_codon:yes stop_codon:yes gene_type:complete